MSIYMPYPASGITGLAFNVWPFWYPFLGCFRITSTQSCSNRNVSRSQYSLVWKLTVKKVILSVWPLPAASGGCSRRRLERHGCRSIRWKAELGVSHHHSHQSVDTPQSASSSYQQSESSRTAANMSASVSSTFGVSSGGVKQISSSQVFS